MRIERGGGHVYVFVPVDGPEGWSTDNVTCEMAMVRPGTTPAEGDWHDADWVGAEVKWLADPSGLADGDWLVKVRLTASLEQVVLTSGRVTLG